MVKKLRARTDEDRQERRNAFLEAAQSLWAERNFTTFTMHEVAELGGFSKPTLYLYFPTKEELLLSLLTELLRKWFLELRIELQSTEKWTSDEIADCFARLMVNHPSMVRLLSLVNTVLEQNVSPNSIHAFKSQLLVELEQTGRVLEAVIPAFESGDGVALLVQVNALVIGFSLMTSPPPLVQSILENNPSYAPLQFELQSALRLNIASLLFSWQAVYHKYKEK
jgi:AcrR family transcriptional regulator